MRDRGAMSLSQRQSEYSTSKSQLQLPLAPPPRPSPPNHTKSHVFGSKAQQQDLEIDDWIRTMTAHIPRPLSLDTAGQRSPIPPHPRSPLYRPTLSDVLRNLAPSPYNLGAFERFLKSQHCVEILYFTLAIAAYKDSHEVLSNCRCAHWTANERRRLKETQGRWRDLIDRFVSTNASHQVNIPGVVREKLLEEDKYVDINDPPPEPDMLQEAEDSVIEMLSDVFPQFLERAAQTSYLQKSPSFGMESSGSTTPNSGFHSAHPSCPASPLVLPTIPSRREYTSGGVYERTDSSERSRSRSDPDLGRKKGDSLSRGVSRNLHFCRELAAKTASLVRISSSDKLKQSPASSGGNSLRTSLDKEGSREMIEELSHEQSSSRKSSFLARKQS